MTAGRLFFVILIFYTFQHVKAQDRPKPSLTLKHAVIRERESIQLICETPSLSVPQCHFIIEGKQKSNPLPCQITLTGYKLLHWAGQSSPVEVKIQCFYMVETYFPSTRSDPVSLRILDHRDLPQPILTVNPKVIGERDSVQLSCVTPPSLSECQCGFYEDGRPALPDTSCKQMVTGTQLLSWTGQKSPAVVQVTCYYIVGRYHTSPPSDPVIVTFQDPPQPNLTVSPSVIRERDTVQLICETPPSVSVSQCNFIIEGKQISYPSPCQSTLTGYKLLHWAGQNSSVEVKIQCFYLVETYYPSTRSDPVSLRILGLTSPFIPSMAINHTSGSTVSITLTSDTPKKTTVGSTTASSTPATSSGLTSPFIPSMAINHTSGSTVSITLTSDTPKKTTVGSTVSITLTSDTPKKTTVGLTVSSTLTTGSSQSSTERVQSSTITVVDSNQESNLVQLFWLAAVGVGSGVGLFLVGLTAVCLCRKTKRNKSQRHQDQQDDHNQHPFGENGQSSEHDNYDIYHLYNSIPDRPAASAQTDGFYSLLMTH
ncbi:uncharacterized protein LOC105008709 [Esox lucius]|uniref:uncharacterized protein LOC105008709 n=1 Tax=Esox lucius TaxID=8010 RepID=UPI001476F1F2|nr:uncharacterized protein LOC105008709 [Esox lucius]